MRPILTTSAAKDRTIRLTCDQPLDQSSAPAPSDFVVTSSGSPASFSVIAVVVLANEVFLSVRELMPAAPATITITYSGTAIRNAQGEALATFGPVAITNSSTGTDNTAPNWMADYFAVNEETLEVCVDETLGFAPPPASAFTVRSTINGVTSTIGVDLVETYGTRIRLTLARAVSSRETITVQYAVPAAQPVRDVAGNAATGFGAVAVINNTSPRAVLSYLTWWRADELLSQMDGDELPSYSASTREQKRRALKNATRDIDSQKWQGGKYDPTQVNEFPRVANGPIAPTPYLPPTVPTLPNYLSMGGEIWDVDTSGVAVVPADVKLACLHQADSIRAGRGEALNAQHDGLSAQAAGPISESYVGTSAGSAAPKLCNEAWELLKRYQLVSGSML